jgi:tetrahydromethanopterin S-methyltransferase subunit G
MTQSNESDDRSQEINRRMTSLNRRVDRLEYAQISPQEFARAFDRVYDDTNDLESAMNTRFDRINERFDRLESEVQEINRKFDIVMQHITGQNGA